MSSRYCLSELYGGWREFVAVRNVLATAWITLLTPEEADNLPAAQQGPVKCHATAKSPANESMTSPGQASQQGSLQPKETLTSKSELVLILYM